MRSSSRTKSGTSTAPRPRVRSSRSRGKAGVDARRFERLHEIAFSSDRKRMSVVARDHDGALWSSVKGSPEAVAECTTRLLGPSGEVPFDARGAHAAPRQRGGHGVVGLPRARARLPPPRARRPPGSGRRGSRLGRARRPHRPAAGRRARGDRGIARRGHPDGHGHGRPEGHGHGRRTRARDRRARGSLPRLNGARRVLGRPPLG